MLTPKSITYPATSNPDEILVLCTDDEGKPSNLTVTDADLAARLATTPAGIPNPEYAPLVETVLAAAVKQIAVAEATQDSSPVQANPIT